MKFTELLEIVGARPIFHSTLLRSGDVDPVYVASQLSRWVAAGKLISLRRGVYALAEPYGRRRAHFYEVANELVRPSYVSTESALSFHGLLLEAVFMTTSVTTARSATYRTALGDFDFRHISPAMMWGYSLEPMGAAHGGRALVARPEKALLDLVYLRPRGDDPAFLRQLRLQRLESLDSDVLARMAVRTGKPKLARAAAHVARMITEQADEYEDL